MCLVGGRGEENEEANRDGNTCGDGCADNRGTQLLHKRYILQAINDKIIFA